jgi:hypothetical protein
MPPAKICSLPPGRSAQGQSVILGGTNKGPLVAPLQKFRVLPERANSGPSALRLSGKAASLEEGTGEATQAHGRVATCRSLQVSGTAPIARSRSPARSECCGPVWRINRSQIVSGARLHAAEGSQQADGWYSAVRRRFHTSSVTASLASHHPQHSPILLS